MYHTLSRKNGSCLIRVTANSYKYPFFVGVPYIVKYLKSSRKHSHVGTCVCVWPKTVVNYISVYSVHFSVYLRISRVSLYLDMTKNIAIYMYGDYIIILLLLYGVEAVKRDLQCNTI